MGNSGINDILKIGLTGGIGSGKSTVCEYFNKLGVPVIDADKIAYELVQPDKPAYIKIIELLGKQYIKDDGKLDRKKIRDYVFSDTGIKKQLEEIIHPLVFEEIEKNIALLDYPYCIICIPLLVETNSQNTVDRILVVDIPEEIQLDRASTRDDTEKSEIIKIINSQEKRSKRLEVADEIIKNDGNKEKLREQVADLHKIYMKLAQNRQNN